MAKTPRKIVSSQVTTSRAPRRGKPIPVKSDPIRGHTSRMLSFTTSVESPMTRGIMGKGEGQVAAIRKAGPLDAFLAPGPPKSKQLQDPFYELYSEGHAIAPPLPPEQLLSLAEENPIHGACLWVKAIDAAGRGWTWEEEEAAEPTPEEELAASLLDEAGVPPVDMTRKFDKMLEAITPEYTFTEMLVQAAWEYDTVGLAAWEVVRNDDDSVGALYPIPAHTIRVTADPRVWVQIRAGRRRYFRKFAADDVNVHMDGGKVDDIVTVAPDKQASEILIFRSYTPRSPWYGVPRWINAIPAMAELTAVREFNVSWFSTGGQSDRLVHVKANELLTAEAIATQLKAQMDQHAGIGHTTLVSHGTADTEVSANKLGGEVREGHFRLRRSDLIKEVLMAHHVPPYRIGWAELGSLGGSAAEEMLDAYNYGSIKPIQNMLEDRLRQTLFGPRGMNITTHKFTLNAVTLDEITEELQKVTQGMDNALYSPNEARQILGEEPDHDMPGMDKRYLKGQPIESVGQQPMQGMPGAFPGAMSFDAPGEPAGVEVVQEFAKALQAVLGDGDEDVGLLVKSWSHEARSAAHARRQAKAAVKAWTKMLTKDELVALPQYLDVAAAVREHVLRGDTLPVVDPDIKKMADDIASALAKQDVPDGLILFRALDTDNAAFLKGLRAGAS